jgi:hypothetical protein
MLPSCVGCISLDCLGLAVNNTLAYLTAASVVFMLLPPAALKTENFLKKELIQLLI